MLAAPRLRASRWAHMLADGTVRAGAGGKTFAGLEQTVHPVHNASCAVLASASYHDSELTSFVFKMLLAIIIRRGRAASERVTRTRGRAVASAASLRYKPGGDGAACRTLRARCRACSPRAAMTTRLLGAHARTRVVMAQRHGVVDCPWPRPAAVPTCCRRRSSLLLHRRSCQRAQLPWHACR